MNARDLRDHERLHNGITVRVTELARTELRTKLEIISDDEDLQESYYMTQDDADALLALVTADGLEVTFTVTQASIVSQELENSAEIAADNDEPAVARAFRKLVKELS